MTIIDKKHFLMQYQEVIRSLNRLSSEKKYWQSMLVRLSDDKSDPRYIERRAKIQKIEDNIDADLDKALETREKILSAVNTIPDEVQRLIIKYRYLEDYSWIKIMMETHFSERHVYRLHNYAIRSMHIDE